MLTPVILFVYKRIRHIQDVIESLGNNLLSKETELFLFSDAAKNKEEQDAVDEVRRYLHQRGWQEKFKRVVIIEATEHKGLAQSVIVGVSQVIRSYGKVIVVEDDLLLSDRFLTYMNGALDFYENETDVWSISGYSFPMNSMKKYPHDIFYSYRGCSWGWGTWKDRWESVDWKVSSYQQFIKDPVWIRKFNRGGKDLTTMLSMQMEGKLDSWAIRWCFAQSSQDKLTVYPKYSYVINNGCDGSGTHSGNTDHYHTFFNMEKRVCNYETLRPERRIIREFRKKYEESFIEKVKRRLIYIFQGSNLYGS